MKDTKQKIVVCDLDNTISDSRERAKKFLYDGYVCDTCGDRKDAKNHLVHCIQPEAGVVRCGLRPDSFSPSCNGKIVQKEKDWAGFFANVGDDKPMQGMVDLLSALHASGYRIVFITSRNESCKEQTLHWIVQNVKMHPVELFMRAEYDRRPSQAVKKDVISHLLDRKRIAFAIDDDLSTIAMYKEQCPNATIIDVSNYLWDDGS